MKCVAIIQARLGSTRLPGKVLLPLAGRPMIERVVERARRVPGLDEVVVATTDLPADDPLFDCLATLGVATFRGSEADVLDRYYQTATNAQADVVVRITADCPLLSPEISGRVLAELLAHRDTCDYASNAQVRTFPRGLDTEAFTFDSLARAHAEAHTPAEREHVTPYLYRSGKFRLRDVTDAVDRSDLRWTVDTPGDFELVRRIHEALGPVNPAFDYEDVLELLRQHPDWSDLNRDVRQKALGE